MMLKQTTFSVSTRGRGTYEISGEVERFVSRSDVRTGLCHIFVHHTSASLILCENADPTVRRDLEAFMRRFVPDGDPQFEHCDEGPDDMPAHVRTVLTHSAIAIPITDGRCSLGTWQGIYLWEHRVQPHRRRLTVTVHGQ